MARKKAEVAEGQAAPEKPKRNYTPSDVLSMKLSKRVTQIVQALAKHYGEKQANILSLLSSDTEPWLVESLRSIQVSLEQSSTSALAGLFDAPGAGPVNNVYPDGPATDELRDE